MPENAAIRLDLTGCRTLQELHERIRITFDFPDWYGCNWDAFYDLLCTNVAENQLLVTGLYTLPGDLQDFIPPFLNVLKDVRKERLAYGESFIFEIIS